MCFPCWEIIIERGLYVGITGIPPHMVLLPPARFQAAHMLSQATIPRILCDSFQSHSVPTSSSLGFSWCPTTAPHEEDRPCLWGFLLPCSHHPPSLHSCEPTHICSHSFLPPITTPLLSLRGGPLLTIGVFSPKLYWDITDTWRPCVIV